MKPEGNPVTEAVDAKSEVDEARIATDVTENKADDSYDRSADGFHGKTLPEKEVKDTNGGDGDDANVDGGTFLTAVNETGDKKKMLSKEDEDLGIYEDTADTGDDLSDTELELERLRAEKKQREQEEKDKLRAEQRLKLQAEEAQRMKDASDKQAEIAQNVRSLTESAIKQIEKQMITPRTDVSLDSLLSSRSWSDPRFLQGISIRDLYWRNKTEEEIPVMTSIQAEILQSSGRCSDRKNVLFLISDDLRPQLGAYDGPNFPTPVHPRMHTPNLDALASRSLLLKKAYVQQALCSPSRSSFLTGRRPDTTRVWDLRHYFRDVGNFTTLPEFFKLQGYRTFGMGKVYHGDILDPLSWTEPYFHGVDNFETRNHSWRSIPDADLKDKPLIDRQIADRAIQTLRSIADDTKTGRSNFFMAVGFRKPHLPFVFPESIMTTYYPDDTIQLPANPYAPVNMPDIAWSISPELNRRYSDIRKLNMSGAINTTFPDQITLELRRGYYSAVTWMDSLVGDVILELERLGLANNTIISFIGDHGYQLGEHAEWGKVTNFELSTHAPMMINIPGLTDHGIATDQLAVFVDLYPTIAEAAGLGSVPICPEDSVHTSICIEGTSMVPLISSPNISIKKAAFSQHPRGQDVMGYTVRTDRYRYTEWVEFQYAPVYKPKWDNISGVELYDHIIDPDENYNGANDAKYQQVRAELSKLLRKGWRHNPADVSVIVG